MTIRDALLTELDLESPFFRTTLQRVPMDKRDWKPHDKSMTMGWLATFLGIMWSWGVIAVEQESFDPTKGGGPPPKVASTTDELLALFDQHMAAYRKALAATDDAHLMKSWTLRFGDKVYFKQPRWLVLRTFIMNHAVHHRAQLGVYLRLNGLAVPAIYNDSADEKGGIFQ